jgi:predicted nucleic acid-binding protein
VTVAQKTIHVADTSFLIAIFDSSDARQPQAREAFQQAAIVVVPTEILVETLGVLKVKVGRRAASEVLEHLLRLPNITWSECCDFLGALAHYRDDARLSFPDAIVVQECISRPARILTFDAHQRESVNRARS